ncbi:MAG: N-acetylmuramic acid 6-phosphate etherase [Firmicutes bacterium]|nr:N-acetylmuramic acid 6-phosphate etherase [Bacillota bacterium]
MKENLGALVTETQNQKTIDLDTYSSLEIVRAMNEEDKTVAFAVEKEVPNIARAVDLIVASFKKGGRLFYVGAGTSGRLGVLDASECPPTFGVPYEMVVPIIAGGPNAFIKAFEDAEDNPSLGKKEILEHNLTKNDTVVGIAASGRTPYVIGALEAAKELGASTVAVVCNPNSPVANAADVKIAPVVGPEVLTGSTRLKAGTAQKMVLNMLTTASMVQMGKVYTNLMVDVQMTNIKLEDRARRIVQTATGAPIDEIDEALKKSGSCKVAIVMILAKVDEGKARELLDKSKGYVRQAIESK